MTATFGAVWCLEAMRQCSSLHGRFKNVLTDRSNGKMDKQRDSRRARSSPTTRSRGAGASLTHLPPSLASSLRGGAGMKLELRPGADEGQLAPGRPF